MSEQIAEREAMIHADIYDQEGVLQPIRMTDTPENRLFAEWLRVHDRYTPQNATNIERKTNEQ